MRVSYLIFAVLISLGAFFVVYKMLGSKPPQEQVNIVQEPQVIVKEVPTKDVYVARAPIAIGEIIDQTKLDRQPWPSHLVGQGFVTAGESAPKIVGMVARAPFQPGEVMIISKLANPEDPGFLAAQLPEGMRAVTISTDPVAGLAGFIYPGDRVDVLFTHTLLGQKEAQAKEEAGEKVNRTQADKRVTEMLLADIRVLAVNQKAIITGEEKERDRLPSSITLEVEQDDAQRLRLAEREGELSLVLRSLHEEAISFVRPSGEEDLTRTLPPAYFPELYGQEGFMEEMPKELMAQKKIQEEKKRDIVLVVRGVHVEEIEFESTE